MLNGDAPPATFVASGNPRKQTHHIHERASARGERVYSYDIKVPEGLQSIHRLHGAIIGT